MLTHSLLLNECHANFPLRRTTQLFRFAKLFIFPFFPSFILSTYRRRRSFERALNGGGGGPPTTRLRLHFAVIYYAPFDNLPSAVVRCLLRCPSQSFPF